MIDAIMKVELLVLVALVVVVMVVRFRGLSLIQPLIQEIAKKKPLVEEKEVLKGFETLEYSLGLALVVILLETYLRYFQITYLWANLVTLILLLIVTILAYSSFSHMKKAFYLITYIQTKRSWPAKKRK